ncbi:MAG: hypothetical protein K6F88_04915, partial [Ruminococcus sp.]|nr:hypothetical protein [Ruminococcus sp.]
MLRCFKKSALYVFALLMFLIGAVVATVIVSATSYHSVRINYCFVDGTPAHDPYIATFTDGASVDIEVTNPNISGYVPMAIIEGDDPSTLPANGTEQKKTSFNIASLQSNETKTVYYLADLTHYAARYYKQNIYDDLYTLDSDLTEANKNLYGYTGDSPTNLENVEITGFTNLFHEPDAIAADGSTVFRVYYDRNYYTVGFDLGEGGYGVEPVYAKYQTVYRIENPERLGYTFLGWARTDKDSTKGDYGNYWHYIDSSGNIIDEATATTVQNLIQLTGDQVVPAKNTYYKAVWGPGSTSFSVVYWVENAEDDNYKTIAVRDFKNVYINNQRTPVTSGMTITADTQVRNYAQKAYDEGKETPKPRSARTNIKIKDLFDFNLNYANPDDPRNADPDPDDPSYDPDAQVYKYDSNNRIIDFNDISKGTSEGLAGKGKYYELVTSGANASDTHVTDTTVTVAGDGSTRFNVFYKRKPFTLKFFYARTDSNNRVYLSGSTSPYSTNTSGTQQGRLEAAEWANCVTVADGVPQIVPKYAGTLNTDTVTLGNYTYYYYTKQVKYGANLRDVWLLDAFESRYKKKKNSNPETYYTNNGNRESIRFGGWAVQNGTVYCGSHSNRTVKGIYEKMDDQMVFTNQNREDFFEL